MATTADYLTQLQKDKQTLVDNLVSKGVNVSSNETFTFLVPKVAEIKSGNSEVNLEDLTITPTEEIQTFNHPGSDGYNKVTVEAIKLQTKEITPTKEEQEVESDEGHNGLKRVLVKPIPDDYIIPAGTLEVTENGEYDVTEKDKVNVSVEATGGVTITNASYLFYYGARLDVKDELLSMCKDITDMKYMFYYCNDVGLTSLDLRGLETSKVTSTMSAFMNNNDLLEVNLEGLDFSSLTDFRQTFYGSKALTSINLNVQNANQITDASSAFRDCTQLTELDLSKFDLSNVTSLAMLCYGCTNLKKINLGNSQIEKVTSLSSTFQNCQNLTEIDLSNFSTSKLSTSSNLFNGCTKLTKVIINKNKTFKLTSTNAFTNTPIANGTGYIYVPDNYVETYKATTNWSTYATQIKGMSELPTEE